METYQTWKNVFLGQGQPCSIKDSHHQGECGQWEGVQEGPIHVAGEDHQIVKIGRKSYKLGEIFA